MTQHFMYQEKVLYTLKENLFPNEYTYHVSHLKDLDGLATRVPQPNYTIPRETTWNVVDNAGEVTHLPPI